MKAEYQENKGPLLSVIVPVYNTAPWLRRCLDSICAQTYTNLEILCVNDGSTDNSAELLAEYAARDSRIKVIHQENAGVSVARNAGLDTATGEYVTFVDADDWLEPDAYGKILPCMEDGVDLVCFGGVIDGEIEQSRRENMEAYACMNFNGTTQSYLGVMRTNVYVWNKIFRKSIIEGYGIQFPVGIACGEDAAFYFCYASVAGLACYLQENVYHYVQQSGSAMAQFRKKSARGLDHLRVVEYVYDFYVKNGVQKKLQAVFDWIFASYYHLTLETTPEEMHPEVHRMAHALALRSGAIRNARHGMIRDLRQRMMGPLERLFHWYAANRECYGISGRAVCSITYEKNCRVYRLLGRVIRTEPVEEPA